MTRTVAEARFEVARKRLAIALTDLEKTVKRKIYEDSVSASMLDATSDDSLLRAKIIEQEAIIQNLSSEINNLQKNLFDLGKETEFLNEKNKILAEKIAEFRREKSSLSIIESGLAAVEEAMQEEEFSS